MKTMKEIYNWVKENITVSDSDTIESPFDIIESPDAVLENKQGNVHSIANLLESMLIENGYQCKKVFMIRCDYTAMHTGIARITKLKPWQGYTGKPPFINTIIICNSNNKYYHLDMLNNDIKGPFEKESAGISCPVHYDVTKDYTGFKVQDYVFDIVNSNIRYGYIICYPVYEE